MLGEGGFSQNIYDCSGSFAVELSNSAYRPFKAWLTVGTPFLFPSEHHFCYVFFFFVVVGIARSCFLKKRFFSWKIELLTSAEP